MQDGTINRTLIALRRKTILEGLDGLEHVEALMALRGVPLAPIRTMPQDRAGRLQMTRLILEALQDGPMPMREIAAHVASQRPEISRRAAYKRTCGVVYRLKCKGAVVREGRGWLLGKL